MAPTSPMQSFIRQTMDSSAQGRPITGAPVIVPVGERSAKAYDDCIAQFGVDHSYRYRATHDSTWCNIFVWDVTSAMQAEIPHWVTPELRPGKPGPDCRELTANQLQQHLDAGRWGWGKCGRDCAFNMAQAGHPAIAYWHNPDGHGHIAMVEPLPRDGLVEVAQAGSICGRHIPLANAFGGREVTFYWHA